MVPATVARPHYDRAAQLPGFVHFGVGAFHRAHQAVYTDAAMGAGDRDWAIIGVSPRSAAIADALNPQSGLYSVREKSPAGDTTRIVGAIRQVIVASRSPAEVIDAIASPDTRVVTLTITEKGYCAGPDERLDQAAAGTIANPSSIHGFLAAGLARRRAAKLPGLTLVSCDNLSSNGARLTALLGEYLTHADASLADWFARECAAPSTMVDRITPAVTPADLSETAKVIGLEDQGAVVTEPFSQWIIEDRFAGPRPRWEAGGARFVADVAPYETAKLRMLNGAHSALAYLGLRRGLNFVHEAIADPAIRPIIEDLIRREAATSFTPAPGQDLTAYADDLLTRFANPALPHALAQIAVDGSQKISQRWFATLEAQRLRGQSCPAILSALAAWLAYLRQTGTTAADPLAARFAALCAANDAAGVFGALFGGAGLFGAHWSPTAGDQAALLAHLTRDPV
jgi:fructuronate reductase